MKIFVRPVYIEVRDGRLVRVMHLSMSPLFI